MIVKRVEEEKEVGDTVVFRMYNTNMKWKGGIIKREVFEVHPEDGLKYRRYVDQMSKTLKGNAIYKVV